MEMPRPTEHHVKLQKLIGSWQGSEIMHPSQWDPEGGEAVGRTSCRLALDGFILVTDYEQERGGKVTFSGHGIWTYDQKQNQVVLYWFDSMGLPPEIFRGDWNGNILTVTHGGPGMHARLTYDLSNEGRLNSQMEMSPDGKTWKVLFNGTYELK